jgi:hypothetical protein
MSLTPWATHLFFVQEWQCAWADGQVQLQGTLPTCEPQVEPTVVGRRSVDPPRVLLAAASWLNPMKYSYVPHKHLETIVIGDDLPTKDRVFPDAA